MRRRPHTIHRCNADRRERAGYARLWAAIMAAEPVVTLDLPDKWPWEDLRITETPLHQAEQRLATSFGVRVWPFDPTIPMYCYEMAEPDPSRWC